MAGTTPALTSVFDTLTAKLCDLNEAEQRVALALYRELLRGVPVSDSQIAQAQSRDVHDVSALLQAPALVRSTAMTTGSSLGLGGWPSCP